MTQKEKTLTKTLVYNAMASYDREQLKELALNDEYALELITDKLLEMYFNIEHIKNIIK